MSAGRKLTQAQAEAIRETWYDTPTTMAALAQRYGVSATVVCNIIHGHTYRDDHMPPPQAPRTMRRTLRRLSTTDAHAIRERRARGETVRALAGNFGVSENTVRKIIAGLTYGDVA